MKSLYQTGIAAIAIGVLSATVNAGDVPRGKPFQYLHRRIDALQIQIDTLIGDVNSLKEWRIAAEAALAELQENTAANAAAIALLEAEIENVKSILDTKQDILTGTCPDGQFVYGVGEAPPTLLCRTDAGANGLAVESVQVSQSVAANSNATVTAECSEGAVVMGGSFEAAPGIEVSASGIEGNGFEAEAANTTADALLVNVTATCIVLAP